MLKSSVILSPSANSVVNKGTTLNLIPVITVPVLSRFLETFQFKLLKVSISKDENCVDLIEPISVACLFDQER